VIRQVLHCVLSGVDGVDEEYPKCICAIAQADGVSHAESINPHEQSIRDSTGRMYYSFLLMERFDLRIPDV